MGTLEDPLACKFMWDGEGIETHICKVPGAHMFHLCICGATQRRESFESLFVQWLAWFDEAMPDCSPQDFIKKFEEESQEFLDAKTPDHQLEEAVDSMVTLWVYAVRQHGISGLFRALHDKLEKNKTRTWVRQADGTYHHV